MVLEAEESCCASSGISLAESWTARERMMAESKQLAARVAGIFRGQSASSLSGDSTTAAPVAPKTSDDGAVAMTPEIGGEPAETGGAGAGNS
jgi:hypothetical protein